MEEAMHYLYKITNTENQKVYIGQTNNPDLRWSQHKSNAKYDRGNQVITRAMTKYGANVFQFEVIATCRTQEDVDLAEEEAIQQYDSRNREKGYNVDRGGNTSPRTSEVVAKISEALQKHYKTHDGWLKGGTLTDEWKENISKASMGKAGTNTGKTLDDEWRIKLSKSQAGKERKSNRRFSDEIEAHICRLYVEENKSTYALGKQFDCLRTTIADILRRYEIETRKSNYTGHSNGRNIFSLEQEEKICELYLTNTVSRAELARKFSCGKTTIRDILLRHSIKL
jgi:group I intron endonuclease